MSECLVALGSNVGDRASQLDRAAELLSASGAIRIAAGSSYHVTRAIGGPGGQSDFLNAAIRGATSLAPRELLHAMRHVEDQMGRTRTVRWDARTIDLDLLLYDEIVTDTPELTVPHPRMAFRRFVLAPAAEVAGEMLHGPTGWTVRELLERLETAPPHIALVGGRHRAREEVVRRAAEVLGCQVVRDPVSDEFEAEVEASGIGWNWETQLEFLHRRMSALRVVAGLPRPAAVTDYVLSDFACVESRALANCAPPGTQRSRFDAAWSAASPSREIPKLVVWMAEASAASSRLDMVGAWVAFQRELQRLLWLPRHCPVLSVQSSDPRDATDEVIAAVWAMQ